MRKAAILAAALLVTACIPRAGQWPGQQPSAEELDADHPQTRQCQSELVAQRLDFRVPADRREENGCTIVGAVQLTDIGTPNSGLGPMKCGLAAEYARWVRENVQPAAVELLGSRVERIDTLGTYSCRPVNGREGARLSEHGHANAVDIAGFRLANGRRVTVLDGWNGEDERVRQFLRTVHGAGCRRFRVVLGPEANALHADHLHFDMGRGRLCR